MSLLQKVNLKLKKPAISKAISNKAFKFTPKVTHKIAPMVSYKATKLPIVVNNYFDDINNDLDKIASFDIGIKNLSYCILSANQSEVKVYDWDIIDLITEEDELYCTAKIKSGAKKGKVCGNKATYFKKGDKSASCCGTHKYSGELVSIKMILLCNETLKNGANKGKKCSKKANHYLELPSGERIGYCSVHSRMHSNLKRYYTVDNITDIELRCRLFKALDEINNFKSVRTILIEHQPNHAREKIKSIAYSVFDYFVLRGMVDTQTIQVIKSIDAKNKLTIYDGPPISCKLKDQYDRNKWYGKKYCEWAIKQKPLLVDFYNKFKKKDDLADCFLQGLWYLKFGKHGKRGNITSNHQKLVYLEQNTAKFIKTRAIKPKTKQLTRGRFTLSNIKYYTKHLKLEKFSSIKGLKESVEFYFTNINNLKKILC